MKYFITASPWPTRIPNGTEIVPVTPPAGKDGDWFKVADGTNPFPEEDGTFKLFSNEFTKK